MIKPLIQKTLTLNKKHFRYTEEGKGKLILLVHGWPETLLSWKNQISFIAKLGYKVVAFNTRGYAGSYSPENISDYAIKYYMKDIIDIINYFNEKEAILIGHDWGAPICWNTAAYYRKNISAVIGLSVPFNRRGKISNSQLWKSIYKNIFFYQNYFQKLDIPEKELENNVYDTLCKIYYWCSADGYKDKIKTSKTLTSGLLDGIPFPKNKMSWLDQENLETIVKDFESSGFKGPLNRYRAQNLDWEQLIELDYLKITQPSIFIGGEYDPVRSFIKDYDAYKKAGKYCENFKGNYIIKDCGHWVQQEKPKEVNQIIKNFLINLN